MKDLTVIMEDQPGKLAELGEATGRAGVNIEGLCAMVGDGKGFIHILVEDGEAVAIESADDRVPTGAAGDVIEAGAGADEVLAAEGKDLIVATEGDDHV